MAPRIVVGVDGSDGSVEALRWALEEARLRGATVEAVHTWHYPYGAYTEITGMAAGVISGEDLAELGREVVDRSLQLAGVASSGVEVKPMVTQGAAAAVLIDAARGADLLVVGSRGHGGFTGLLLGSVSQHAVHHATCPVVVVPHRR